MGPTNSAYLKDKPVRNLFSISENENDQYTSKMHSEVRTK